MLTIGTGQLTSPLVLAPLSGISDLPYRAICRRFGCELAATAMVSARSLAWRNIKTEKLLATRPGDRPLSVQLLGSDPDVIARALDALERFRFDLIDLNAACPVPKVVRKGEGAALLKEPHKLHELLRLIVKRSRVPVTVKIRAGWDKNSPCARDIALYALDAGVSCVCVHGRTRAQGYGGRVSYDIIREVKQALTIPVIGSGDAFSPILIRRMFDETGCDGVAIARGALETPGFSVSTTFLQRRGPCRPGPRLRKSYRPLLIICVCAATFTAKSLASGCSENFSPGIPGISQGKAFTHPRIQGLHACRHVRHCQQPCKTRHGRRLALRFA